MSRQTGGAADRWDHAAYLAAIANIARLTEQGTRRETDDASRALLETAIKAGDGAYLEAPFDLAGAYFQRGRVLQTIGAFEDAMTPLREAQRQFQRLTSRSPHAESMVLVVQKDIGDCFRNLGRLTQAADTYALVIEGHHAAKRLQDAAIVKCQLAMVLASQLRQGDAIAVLSEAYDTFTALGDSAYADEVLRQIRMMRQDVERSRSDRDAD